MASYSRTHSFLIDFTMFVLFCVVPGTLLGTVNSQAHEWFFAKDIRMKWGKKNAEEPAH